MKNHSNKPPQTIPGSSGELEAELSPPKSSVHPEVVGIVCHPHPLFGGSMRNKVVTTVVRAFQDVGMGAVSFNFRGVGKSEGVHDQGVGEVEDLLAVIKWVQQHFPGVKIVLAGFSFGANIAFRVAIKQPVSALITIAPPVSHSGYDFSGSDAINCPWLVIQGEQDEVVDPAAVFNWAAKQPKHPDLIKLPTATHFFHGHLPTLRQSLKKWLEKAPTYP